MSAISDKLSILDLDRLSQLKTSESGSIQKPKTDVEIKSKPLTCRQTGETTISVNQSTSERHVAGQDVPQVKASEAEQSLSGLAAISSIILLFLVLSK